MAAEVKQQLETIIVINSTPLLCFRGESSLLTSTAVLAQKTQRRKVAVKEIALAFILARKVMDDL